jgi:biotin carboxyl carrier protein
MTLLQIVSRTVVPALVISLFAPASAASAQTTADPAAPPSAFHLPIACPDGLSCPVQNYFDRADGPEVLDFACGGMTYDGHDGTDFRLPTVAAMEAGVPVVAAAAGTVLRLRDGIDNHDGSDEAVAASVSDGKECGNGLVVDIGGGWETQYCHLSPGLAVKEGDTVAAGQTLGTVGMTGAAAFPHVHFEVRHDGASIDPFRPDPAAACGTAGNTEPTSALWAPDAAAALAYESPRLLNAGFAAGPVTMQAIDADIAATPPGADAPALVFFTRAIGLKGGDVQTLALLAPDGSVVAEQTAEPLDRDKAQWMVFTGRKRRGAAWPSGEYRGRYTVERARETVLTAERTVVIP